MNKLFKTFSVFVAFLIFVTACGQTVSPQREEQVASKGGSYEALLGKSVMDTEVADYIAANRCSSIGQVQVCKEVGMDLWVDASQIVQMVYLYLNNNDGYSAYKGELPFGLKFYDIQGAVEYKLERQGVGNAGLPNEGSSPDHFHYWAVYEKHNMIVIYNSPYPDEDATIYAIVVSK
ncbi:MAG TPA: hypothetical protein VJ821_13510 [Anaerolineales bacterium]|nr:hypothetical protein [Anaerolineales bacterium]